MSQQQRPPADTTSFVIGLVVGLFVGGTAFTLTIFMIGLLIAAALQSVAHDASTFIALGISYAIAVGAGVWGFVLVRKNVGFLSGFVIGLAAGLLGGITVCSGIMGGLNNMH